MIWLWQICTILALTSCAYALAASALVGRFARRPRSKSHNMQGLTILKPLYGDEPHLFKNLSTFCQQAYQGPVQVIFGVQRPDDPAIKVVERLIAALPDKDICLIIDERQHGANRKVSNLINMEERARHEVIVLADSDMRVEPDYLDWVMGALDREGVGLVTCLYRGAAAAGIWSKFAVQAIDYHFLPNVLVGLSTGLAHPCFGSTIALKREILREIGGFRAVKDQLADDYALGDAVRRLGLKIAVPSTAIVHFCSDASFLGLLRHELRWARTIALVDPKGFAGLAITHALPLALLSWGLGGFTSLGASVVALALACRLILQIKIAASFALPSPNYWLGPLRDLLSFAVFAGCFFVKGVDWRGERYAVEADGRMEQASR